MQLYVVGLLGAVLIGATLLDAFEVVLLPRPVRHRLRLNRYFFLGTWSVWSRLASRLPAGRQREDFIGIYGPLSMVLLFALWAVCLIVGFGLLQWALREATSDGPSQSLAREMIVSGDAFFALGYGDIVPRTLAARLLVIVEAGTGFGFVALTISYLPALCQHFAQRDAQIIEFAARAGTPPSAAQRFDVFPVLRRQREADRTAGVVACGDTQLAAELPGGGWPQGMLTDILIQQSGCREIRLLRSALAAVAGRPVILLQPPHRVQPAAFAWWGLSAEHVRVLRAEKTADALWAAEQVLRAGTSAALIFWQTHVRPESLRRLHLAAQAPRPSTPPFTRLKVD